MTAINTEKPTLQPKRNETEQNKMKNVETNTQHMKKRWFLIMMLSRDKNKQNTHERTRKNPNREFHTKSILSDERGFVDVVAVFAVCSAYLVRITRSLIRSFVRSFENRWRVANIEHSLLCIYVF